MIRTLVVSETKRKKIPSDPIFLFQISRREYFIDPE